MGQSHGRAIKVKAGTWNTWDVNCLNAVMRMPELCEVRVSVYDDELKRLQEEMLWRDVPTENTPLGPLSENLQRLGPHHPTGRYFDLDLKYRDLVFNTRFACRGDSFVYKITPVGGRPGLKFFINALFRWNAAGSLEKTPATLVLKTAGQQFVIDFSGVEDTQTRLNATTQGFLFETTSPVYVRCNNTLTVALMEEFLDEAEAACTRELVSGQGLLDGCPEAIVKGLLWNTIYEPIKDRVCTPVARTWCTANGAGFGSYVLFDWDTFFASILSGIQDKQLAYQQIDSILQEITPSGFVPNFGAQRSASLDRSQPPVGSYCVLKLYHQFGERSLLENTYGRLAVWNAWWMGHRDGNNDGLLEWGSDPFEEVTKLGYESNNLQAAMYESGLDNSPMYDGVVYNSQTHTMELADVGLNALYALDCWALAEMAALLDRPADAERHRAEFQRMKTTINAQLWDEEAGIYANKDWQGRFSPRYSPTNFYPMLAGLCSPEQARRMVSEHLLNPQEFWGEYVIPSIARNDPAFGDNDYWRGRIWGPMNFLVAEGLKRQGFYHESFLFARKSLSLLMREWQEENHIHENYNAVTGDGDDKKNADALYTWGALLGQVAVAEYIEAQAWGGLRLGNLSGVDGGVTNFCLGEQRCSVRCGALGLSFEIDGLEVLRSDAPMLVTGFLRTGSTLGFSVQTNKPGKLWVCKPLGVQSVQVQKVGPVTVVER